jgi:arsenical pump membrane protein
VLSAPPAALGIIGTAIVLMAPSALDIQLGLPTVIAGALTAVGVLIRTGTTPWPILKNISLGRITSRRWTVCPRAGT